MVRKICLFLLRWVIVRIFIALVIVVVGGYFVVKLQRVEDDGNRRNQSLDTIRSADMSYYYHLYEDSLQELTTAYDIASTISDENKKLDIYGHILTRKGSCEIQIAIGSYSEVNISRAIKYSNEGLALVNPDNFPALFGRLLFNLASAYHVRFENLGEQSDRENSIKFYRESLNYFPQDSSLYQDASNRIGWLEGY
ncbi:hypothetical protein ACFLW9_03300 [Chloroflexota bacterium]